jgi:hypothetical protein
VKASNSWLTVWPWLVVFALGLWHGLNPAMGWLFAVALGLQRKSRTAVFGALLPIGFGHLLAMLLIVVPAVWLGTVIPLRWLQWTGGLLLLGLGGYKLLRARHPTWVGMRVGFWDLTLWSGFMATAHGAGLMLIPVVLGARGVFCGPVTGSGVLLSWPFLANSSLSAAVVHTVGHLLVAGLAAFLVFEFVGLNILRRSWFNIDMVWSLGLIVAGCWLLYHAM